MMPGPSPSLYGQEIDAELGSALLLKAIIATQPPQFDRPTRRLTFEEQLAAVEKGARLVTIHPIRKADPDYTLGGVCW